jgi:hypothetical protein
MLKQDAAVSCVLAGNQVDRLQHLDCALGHVTKIPDRR